ncbi:reverse transcriptase [Elysia marginata]|uniref:Reverse transcriptase n=1 Tax=Elysia marginata TaxID=1093978 RepID=A0AAV4H8K6_9GAST|nr:reverse transcriptase [Elysia marginata]
MKVWMMTNKLKLYDDKTEIIILGKDVHSIPTTTLNINGNIILTSKRIKNLGVYLDNGTSISSHVNVCRAAYFKIRKRSTIQNILDWKVTTALITTLCLQGFQKILYKGFKLSNISQPD